MEKLCPNDQGPLEKKIGPLGEYYECGQCGYKENELETLLSKQSQTIIYKSPVDNIPLQKKRIYLVKASYFERVGILIGLLSLLLTGIFYLLQFILLTRIFFAMTVVSLGYIIVAYLKQKRRIRSSKEIHEAYIVDRLNETEHLEQYAQECSISFLRPFYVFIHYVGYCLRSKKRGLPYRFKTDPVFSDLIMIKVRRETDTNRRIRIQNQKNELENLYQERKKAIDQIYQHYYKDYGYQVAISYALGRVSINQHIYSFDELLKASMSNHVFKQKEDVIVKEGYYKSQEEMAIDQRKVADLTTGKIIYDADANIYKHSKYVPPVTKEVEMTYCDSMKIIIETRKGQEEIELMSQRMDVTSKEYIQLQNTCYNITGGIRRASRTPMPTTIPEIEDSEEVKTITEEMITLQNKLLKELKSPPIYKVPDMYKG